MSYTAQDLITIFRREVDDTTYNPEQNLPNSDSFWSNYELLNLLNEVQKEFAERTLCIQDSETFRPVIYKDVPWANYDYRILRVERAELLSSNKILPIYTIEDFQTKNYIDDYGIQRTSSWENHTGSPKCLIRDIKQDFFRVYPIPTENDQLLLTVKRLPLKEVILGSDNLEIPERWQYGLLNGMRKYAYKTPKAILAGYAQLAVLAQKEWEDFINHAMSRTKIRTRGPGQVRYGGIK